jgi:hypothetical protein
MYLGTVSARPDGGHPLWRVQSTNEAHRHLDDAVRALRRPASWPREREQAARWARRLLADQTLTAVDVESVRALTPESSEVHAGELAALGRSVQGRRRPASTGSDVAAVLPADLEERLGDLLQ